LLFLLWGCLFGVVLFFLVLIWASLLVFVVFDSVSC
jgi:hypothetical protein